MLSGKIVHESPLEWQHNVSYSLMSTLGVLRVTLAGSRLKESLFKSLSRKVDASQVRLSHRSVYPTFRERGQTFSASVSNEAFYINDARCKSRTCRVIFMPHEFRKSVATVIVIGYVFCVILFFRLACEHVSQ